MGLFSEMMDEWSEAQSRIYRLESGLRAARDELREEIDGATESVGRDTRISRIIRICEMALDGHLVER